MKVTPTYKTGFSNESVIPVERVHRVYKSRSARDKWKENLYIIDRDKLTEEEVSAVVEEIEKKDNIKEETPMEAYERMNSVYNPLKDKLQGKSR